MATSAKAADAAQEAALAETLLLWGGPLLRRRPLLQVAELVAAGGLERSAQGAVLKPSPGTPVVHMCCGSVQISEPLHGGVCDC